MKTFLRKVRMALTPRSFLLKSKLSGGVVVLGQNRKGSGGRSVYLSRDSIEPQLEHLERLLGSLGSDPVFVDVGASTGIYALKAAPLRVADGDANAVALLTSAGHASLVLVPAGS
jgi:hypothetical protein